MIFETAMIYSIFPIFYLRQNGYKFKSSGLYVWILVMGSPFEEPFRGYSTMHELPCACGRARPTVHRRPVSKASKGRTDRVRQIDRPGGSSCMIVQGFRTNIRWIQENMVCRIAMLCGLLGPIN